MNRMVGIQPRLVSVKQPQDIHQMDTKTMGIYKYPGFKANPLHKSPALVRINVKQGGGIGGGTGSLYF